MTGLLTILEGAGKGTSKSLTSALMIVGRSKNADLQVEDPLVSRRHLEIRVEADGVFVENKSTQGSSLNGKPLVGVVSLNPGDVIEIGTTKMRFEEAAAAPPPSAMGSASFESEIDGTRIADPGVEVQRQKKEAAADETRAVVEDGTRMLNAAELPNWVAQEKKEKKDSSKGMLAGVFLIVLLALAGGGYWYMFMRGTNSHTAADGLMNHKDALYSFSMQYPLDWSKITDDTGVIVFGFGGKGDPEQGRLKIFTDKGAGYDVTGLTDGFLQYEDTLRKRYQNFELSSKKEMKVHNVMVVAYWFSTPTLEGKGLYALNGDSRIVAECISPQACYEKYNSTYSSILQSFQLGEFMVQQYIDYPMPDESMQQLALSNPSELSRQVDQYTKQGEMLLTSKDVNPGNLFNSMKAFQKAIQLSIAGPQRLPVGRNIAGELAQATTLLNQALERQRFEINQALKVGDLTRAYWGANKMMQMVSDKTDPAYQEAYRIIQTLPTPKEF